MTALGASHHHKDYGPVGEQAIKLAKRTILPITFLIYFFNSLDRANLGFAALQMNSEMHISAVDFGNLVSAFFVSYLIFQIPSNMAIERLGAKLWIGTIVVGWGCATMLMFVVQDTTQMMLARFLLGVFEAGFFPGIIFFFALWFPDRERAKVTVWFMLASAGSALVAGPASGWFVGHVYFFGHAGWRWLFIIEGVPTIILGVLSFFVLSSSPKEAKWLPVEQRDWLVNKLETERAGLGAVQGVGLRGALCNPVLWKLAVVYMCAQGATQMASFWFPPALKAYRFGLTDTHVGLLMAVPYIFGLLTMMLWARSSDRTGERKWHTGIPMLVCALSFLILAIGPSLWMKILALALFGMGSLGYYGPFWAMPAAMLSPAELAVSIAFINSCSSLGGLITSQILGYADKSFGSTGIFLAMTVMAPLSVLVLMTMKVPRAQSVSADLEMDCNFAKRGLVSDPQANHDCCALSPDTTTGDK